jgi:RNA polymerase sigma factor (sigma-70 family)
MEVSALKYSGSVGLHARSPLLRLQSDERLVTLTRRGNTTAFEVLVARYSSRLLAFCRHLLGSREDAEDVLQEIFAASFNAILADDRPINVRPWLYRIARNRCLNHLRRIQAIGVDSMDVHFSDHGASTADKVHEREEFRMLVGDINDLPETQRTALVLREMDALSYEQIAEAMETTVSSVKSLLVRARISLAEAAEARLLTCEEVRIELGEVAEGLIRRPSPLVRRHLRACKRCSAFKVQLKETNKALAALMPIGPLVLLKKFALSHIPHSAGSGATAAGGGATAAGGGATAAGSAAAGGSIFAGSTAGGFVSAGVGAIATKAAAGIAAAALVTAGAVEVSHVAHPQNPVYAMEHGSSSPPSGSPRGGGAAAGTHEVTHTTRTATTEETKTDDKKTSAQKQTPTKPTLVAMVTTKPTVTKSATTTATTSSASTTTAATTTASTTPTDPATTTTTTTTTTTLPGRTQTQTDPTVLNPGGPGTTTETSTGTTTTSTTAVTTTDTATTTTNVPVTTVSTTTTTTGDSGSNGDGVDGTTNPAPTSVNGPGSTGGPGWDATP